MGMEGAVKVRGTAYYVMFTAGAAGVYYIAPQNVSTLVRPAVPVSRRVKKHGAKRVCLPRRFKKRKPSVYTPIRKKRTRRVYANAREGFKDVEEMYVYATNTE